MSDFPRVKFGQCERSGRTGNDIDTDTGASTAASGYELIEYEGMWLSQLEINWLEDERNRDVFDDRLIEEERFRQRAGVTKA